MNEAKQNAFLNGMFYSWFTARFCQKHQNLAFGLLTEYLLLNSRILEILL